MPPRPHNLRHQNIFPSNLTYCTYPDCGRSFKNASGLTKHFCTQHLKPSSGRHVSARKRKFPEIKLLNSAQIEDFGKETYPQTPLITPTSPRPESPFPPSSPPIPPFEAPSPIHSSSPVPPESSLFLPSGNSSVDNHDVDMGDFSVYGDVSDQHDGGPNLRSDAKTTFEYHHLIDGMRPDFS